jgi:hypothetical protein
MVAKCWLLPVFREITTTHTRMRLYHECVRHLVIWSTTNRWRSRIVFGDPRFAYRQLTFFMVNLSPSRQIPLRLLTRLSKSFTTRRSSVILPPEAIRSDFLVHHYIISSSSLVRVKNVHFSTSSTPALGPTQSTERGLFHRVLSGRGVKLTTHLQLVSRSRKHGSIHPFPYTPSWRSA